MRLKFSEVLEFIFALFIRLVLEADDPTAAVANAQNLASVVESHCRK